MAERVDSMSDAELRTKLAEHGFPVMPITDSTRSLLVKKLKLVLENKSKGRNDGRRSLARYSSGEESDLDNNKETKEMQKTRRATVAGAMLPPVAARMRRTTPKKDLVESEKDSESEDEKSPIKTHEEVETITTRRITRTYKPSGEHEEYETGSDSEVDVVTGTSPKRSDSRASDHNITSTRISPLKPSLLSSRPSLSTTGYSSPQSASESLNSIRSRLGLAANTSYLDRPTTNYNSNYNFSTRTSTKTNADEVESPYLSSFTRRLTSLNTNTRPLFDSDTTNGRSSYGGATLLGTGSRSPITDFRSVGEKKTLRNNIVSFTLVGIVALFFLGLSFMYLGMKSDATIFLEDKNNVIPICQINLPGNRAGINCIPKDQVNDSMSLLKVLYPEIVSRATAYKCGDSNVTPYMDNNAILAYAVRNSLDDNQIYRDLYNLHVLLNNNPKWGISIVSTKNIYSQELERTALASMEEITINRNQGTAALTVLNPSIPVTCLLANTLYSASVLILVLAVTVAIAFGSHSLYNYYISYQKRKSNEIHSMVEQIIDILSAEGEAGDSCLPVDHVRDMLIQPQHRENMAGVWAAAVNFLQNKESRVRLEVQTVNGEDFKVWRWISPGGCSPRRSGAAWQGQAFETQEGSVNSLSVSPTPCLKIRHMFDKNDTNPDLKATVQDAILEKCGTTCKILHVEVERASCCVYVKCASQADAGVVYKNLHGWWYDGNLITVKYLRLERYMERFPLSPATGPPLRPSGRLSRGDQ